MYEETSWSNACLQERANGLSYAAIGAARRLSGSWIRQMEKAVRDFCAWESYVRSQGPLASASPVDFLPLSNTEIAILARLGIESIGQLIEMGGEPLRKSRRVGHRTYLSVRKALLSSGLVTETDATWPDASEIDKRDALLRGNQRELRKSRRANARARDARIARALSDLLECSRVYTRTWESGADPSMAVDLLCAAARQLGEAERPT